MYPWTGSSARLVFVFLATLLLAGFTGSAAAVGPAFSTAVAVSESATPGSPAEDKPGIPDVWRPLVGRLVTDGLDGPYVRSVFSSARLQYDPGYMARKIDVLLDVKLRPKGPDAEPVPEIQEHYLNPILLAGGYGYWREHKDILSEIRVRYEVPEDILVALMLVETKLGRNTGSHNALTTLASLAASDDLDRLEPHLGRKDLEGDIREWAGKKVVSKANWAYGELKALIRYAKDNGLDPLSMPSSVYGAVGLCQFMPTSAVAYGVDGDGDGRVDLFSRYDALHSMANYLRRNGWRKGLDRSRQLKVIYRYNHSMVYSRTILAVAERLRSIQESFGD